MKKRLSDLTLEELEELLRKADECSTTSKNIHVTEEDRSILSQIREWFTELKPRISSQERHFELEELSRLAQERYQKGEAWEMPEHLSRCSLCLEAYQILLEGHPSSSPKSLQRYIRLFETENLSQKIIPWKQGVQVLLKLAASIVLLLGLALTYNHLFSKKIATVGTGTIALENGRVLQPGESIPSGTTLIAQEHTRTQFKDGSQVEINKDTKLALGNKGAAIELQQGSISVSVAKQKNNGRFNVKTPFGEAIAIGTQFTVSYGKEDVTIYKLESQAPAVLNAGKQGVELTMNVKVLEGVVLIKSKYDQAQVSAGQIAIVRENDPYIDIFQQKPSSTP